MKRLFASLLLVNVIAVAIAQGPSKEIAYYVSQAPFKMQMPNLPKFSNKTFNIKDYGAVGDGQFINTNAIAKTIDACAAAGGGTVIIPAGLWLTGPIQMKSNINLHVERGALVQFTTDHTQYPMIKSSNTSNSIVPASPVYGYDLENIAITGEGILDGAGETWRPVKKDKMTESQWKKLVVSGGALDKDQKIWWPSKEALDGEDFLKTLKNKKTGLTPEDYIPARDYLRPYMVYFVHCKNMLLQDVTIRNSPKFVFYPNDCNNLTIDHVNIFNAYWAQNGDGMDISACKNVVIYRCNVSAGDDGICMKSSAGKNSDPNNFALENLVIAGCTVYHAHGGFVIGSNTDGGMRNIFVDECNFIGTDIGVRVKSSAGRGGLVKDIYVRNIYMKDIINEAISFDTYYENRPAGFVDDPNKPVPTEKIPEFRDFHFNNIYCNGATTAIAITGLPQMHIHDIQFDTILITANKGVVATEASGIALRNVKVIPANGPIYSWNNASDITINHGFLPPGSKQFLAVTGKAEKIKITGTILPKDESTIQLGANVSKQAIIME
jgi:polygalacturonase